MQEEYFLILLRKNVVPFPNLGTSSNLACKQEMSLSINDYISDPLDCKLVLAGTLLFIWYILLLQSTINARSC